MASDKPLSAVVERLIEQRKAGKLPEPAKRKPVKRKPVLDASIPKNRTLH